MSSKLRLAAAQLTDVGRRRERNQDRVASSVPEDEAVLEQKGALFVVCDGMGGHAAGEVAAELGASTLISSYYSIADDALVGVIARSIDQANQAIYQHARQHPEHAGMGTTCVAAVLAGGRAYIVNIGDSRAYILRDGQMRQVTQDHSWVGEQVRIGLLTEEAARTHAHRNVITRSLGTQPTVTADLFVETLQAGDRLLLCSDGLHGYVETAEIVRTVREDDDPTHAAQVLVDMANENGGPDNISVVIVHLLEVPAVVGELKLPTDMVPADEPVTQPLAISTGKMKAVTPAKARSGSRQRTPAKPLTRAARLTRAAVRVLALCALLLVGISAWSIAYGPLAASRAAVEQMQQSVLRARADIQRAENDDPTQALALLATARTDVLAALSNPQLDALGRTQGNQFLQTELTTAVRRAVRRYDAAARIVPLAPTAITLADVRCTTPQQTDAGPLAAVQTLTAVSAVPGSSPTAARVLYAVNSDTLYQITQPLTSSGAPQPNAATCRGLALPGTQSVAALAADGSTLYALVKRSNDYAVVALTPDGVEAGNLQKVKVETRYALPAQAAIPRQLAVRGDTVYIAFTGATSGIWQYGGNAPRDPTQPLPNAPPKVVTLAQPAESLAVVDGLLYVLLADGTLGQFDAGGTFVALPVNVPMPVVPADPEQYTSAAPVPTPHATLPVPTVSDATPTATAASAATASPTTASATAPGGLGTNPGTMFASRSTLVADAALSGQVFINDGANHRVVRLATAKGGPGLGLMAQYVYHGPVTTADALAVAAANGNVSAYVWAGGRLATFDLPAQT